MYNPDFGWDRLPFSLASPRENDMSLVTDPVILEAVNLLLERGLDKPNLSIASWIKQYAHYLRDRFPLDPADATKFSGVWMAQVAYVLAREAITRDPALATPELPYPLIPGQQLEPDHLLAFYTTVFAYRLNLLVDSRPEATKRVHLIASTLMAGASMRLQLFYPVAEQPVVPIKTELPLGPGAGAAMQNATRWAMNILHAIDTHTRAGRQLPQTSRPTKPRRKKPPKQHRKRKK